MPGKSRLEQIKVEAVEQGRKTCLPTWDGVKVVGVPEPTKTGKHAEEQETTGVSTLSGSDTEVEVEGVSKKLEHTPARRKRARSPTPPPPTPTTPAKRAVLKAATPVKTPVKAPTPVAPLRPKRKVRLAFVVNRFLFESIGC
jgi:hypothetical protein